MPIRDRTTTCSTGTGDDVQRLLLAPHPSVIDPAHDVRHDRDPGLLQRFQARRDSLDPEGDVVDPLQRLVVADDIDQGLIHPGLFRPAASFSRMNPACTEMNNRVFP